MATKFAARMIETLKSKQKRFDRRESGRAGFVIRVYPGSGRSWVYIYRFDGIKRRMTLGKYPAMTLATAHSAHARAEMDRAKGIDPGAVKVKATATAREVPKLAERIGSFLIKT